MGIFGILLSLGLLIYLAYRGIPIILLAPLMSFLAIYMDGGMDLMPTLSVIFSKAMGGFIAKYFLLFLLGAFFGSLMDSAGYAKSIANFMIQKIGMQNAIGSVVVSCAIMTYGGVSLFVVAFSIYPLAVRIFEQSETPRTLIPAAIALGSFTFTMTALPGTPSIQNAIPMGYFGTNLYSAPILGTIAAIIMFSLGIFWLEFRKKKIPFNLDSYKDIAMVTSEDKQNRNIFLSFLPIILVLILNFILTFYFFPNQNYSTLDDRKFSGFNPKDYFGIWSIIIALSIAILYIYLINWNKIHQLNNAMKHSVIGSLLPLFNTATEVGYGATIAGLASFIEIKLFLLNIFSNPILTLALTINVLAGCTGSASGGLSISLEVLGDHFLEIARSTGTSVDLMHRVATISSGGLDALPHNGAVITLLSICGLTHKESYPDIAMVAVVFPIFALCVLIFLGSILGGI